MNGPFKVARSGIEFRLESGVCLTLRGGGCVLMAIPIPRVPVFFPLGSLYSVVFFSRFRGWILGEIPLDRFRCCDQVATQGRPRGAHEGFKGKDGFSSAGIGEG